MDFWRYAGVMVQLLLAALCVYLLGLFFASIASAIADLRGSPDFAGHRSADSSDYVYLSFT
jgi:hypothetical protein